MHDLNKTFAFSIEEMSLFLMGSAKRSWDFKSFYLNFGLLNI